MIRSRFHVPGSKLGNRIPSSKNLEPRTSNLEPGTWNPEPGTAEPNLELGTAKLNPEPRSGMSDE